MAHDFFIRSVESAGRPAAGLALLMLALSAGCGRSTTVVGPHGERVTVKQKGDGVDVTFKDKHGKEGHVAAGEKGVALPDDFPKDVAVYPKATVVTSMTMEKTMHVSLKTADSAEKVAAFYKKKLDEDGWKINTNVNTEQMRMLQASKGKADLGRPDFRRIRRDDHYAHLGQREIARARCQHC